MALLVEGLEVGSNVSIEKYIIGPATTDATEERAISGNKESIKLYGAEQGLSWVARPITAHDANDVVSLGGSLTNQSTTNIPFMDPVVTLFGSVQENLPDVSGSMKSMLFPNFGSMFAADSSAKPDNRRWDEESVNLEDEEYASDVVEDDNDDCDDTDGNIQSPLLSRHATLSMEQVQQPINAPSNVGETLTSTNIGGGWQLAWKWSEQEVDRRKEGSLKRIYMHQEGAGAAATGSRHISVASFSPESGFVQASALVSQSALYSKDCIDQHPAELMGMLHPAEPVVKGPRWSDLFESGVKHALIVGIGIQMFQQV